VAVVIPVDFGLASWSTVTPLDPEPMVWTLGLDLTGAADIPSVPDLMEDVWTANLLALTSSVVDLVETRVKMGPVATGPTFISTWAISGTATGSLLPPNCAVLAKKVTALGGRENQGRAYLPGITSFAASLDTSGTFSAANALTITNAMNQLRDDLIADVTIGPAFPVILHSSASPPTQITEWAVSNKLATQRRRLRP
jgi:hypothetical protein